MTSRQQVVYNYLHKEVLGSIDGDRLPTVRSISRKCGVSVPTVLAVLDHFSSKGLINSTPGRGIYRTSQDVSDLTQQIDVVYFGTNEGLIHSDSFHGQMKTCLATHFGQRGQGTRLHVVPFHTRQEDIDRLLGRLTSSACVLINCSVPSLGQELDRRHIRYVYLFPNSHQTPPRSVVIDNEQLMRMQLNHLVAFGHRAVGYLHQVQQDMYHRDQLQRREIYYRLVAEMNLDFRPHFCQYGGYDPEQTVRTTRDILAEPDRPTALICADYQLHGVYHTAGELGLKIGQDLAVLGTDDLPHATQMYPPASSLRTSRQHAARLAQDILESDAPDILHLPLELVQRASTQAKQNQPYAGETVSPACTTT